MDVSVLPTLTMGQSSSTARDPPPLDFGRDCVLVERDPSCTVESGVGTESPGPACKGGSAVKTSPAARRRLSLFLSRPMQISNIRRRWSTGPNAVVSKSLHTTVRNKPISSPASLESSAGGSSSPAIADYASEPNESMDLGKGGNGPDGVINPLTTARSGMTVPAHETRHGMKQTDETSSDDFVKGPQGGYKSETRGDTDVTTRSPRITTMLDNIIEDHAVQIQEDIAPQTSPAAVMGRNLKAVPSPRRAMSLPASTSVCSLDTLQEGEMLESTPPDPKTIEGKTSKGKISTVSPDSAIRTPCKDVWLCSKPTRSPASPASTTIPSPPAPTPPSPHLAHGIVTPPSQGGAKRNRQFVTRAMSTGRIAREFDEEGRIICLSSHSERVLWAKQVHLQDAPSRSSSPVRPPLDRSYSAQTPSSPLSSTASTTSRVVTPVDQRQFEINKERRDAGGSGILQKRKKGHAMMNEVSQAVTGCRGDQLIKRSSWTAESKNAQKCMAGL